MAGSDAGARIIAAFAALGPEGGVIDARGLVPSLTAAIPFPCEINTTIPITKPIQLLLGAATYLINVTTGAFAVLGTNFSVIGIHRVTTTLQMNTGGPVFAPSGTWPVGSGSFTLERLALDGLVASFRERPLDGGP